MPVCPEILFCSYKVSYSVVSKFSYESVKWGESRINQGLTWNRKKKVSDTQNKSKGVKGITYEAGSIVEQE